MDPKSGSKEGTTESRPKRGGIRPKAGGVSPKPGGEQGDTKLRITTTPAQSRIRFYSEPAALFNEDGNNGDADNSNELSKAFPATPPIDEAYQPKLIKCQTDDGNVRPVSPDLLREAGGGPCLPSSKNAGNVPREPESRVMVLYTGGTIGMKQIDGAYAPEANYLPKALRQLPHLNDQAYVDAHYSGVAIPPCVLPPVKGEERRIVYWVFEYEPLLDSCDMTFDDWIRIGDDIYNAYEKYDGFVLLHGTDTLCYTASALSFMFENLGKTIVITGAQIPVAEVRSDGRENFLGALIVAANYDIPEVTVYFNNKLFRGNRTSKVDNSGLDAFNSPNIPPLAAVEISIKVQGDAIFRSPEAKKVRLHTHLSRRVGLLRVFPSVSLECVRAFLQPSMEGVVLQTYGAGNIPKSRTDILDELKKAVDRGMVVVNCSQCSRGQVTSNYQTGKILADIGVVPGSDMTPETALTKLAYVLGKEDLNLNQKKKWMRSNLRGELTTSRNQVISFHDDDVIQRLAKFLHISTTEEMVSLRRSLYPPLVCAAASKDDVPLLRHLRDCGAMLAAADYDHRTALHVAATWGHLDAVKFLLEEGVSVHMRDHNEETPLLAAVRRGHLEVVKILMETGAHLTVPSHALAVELCLLVSKQDLQTLEAWRVAGVDFNVTDYDKRTPLHVASNWGYADIVQFLLDSGALPTVIDCFGNQPIDDAIRNGHSNVVALLKEWTTDSKNGMVSVHANGVNVNANGISTDMNGISVNGAASA